MLGEMSDTKGRRVNGAAYVRDLDEDLDLQRQKAEQRSPGAGEPVEWAQFQSGLMRKSWRRMVLLGAQQCGCA